MTNKARKLKQKGTQTVPNDRAEHTKIKQHWMHQHDRRHRHNKPQNSGNNHSEQQAASSTSHVRVS
eukprot:4163539-Prymnesium_polylepis.1